MLLTVVAEAVSEAQRQPCYIPRQEASYTTFFIESQAGEKAENLVSKEALLGNHLKRTTRYEAKTLVTTLVRHCLLPISHDSSPSNEYTTAGRG
jgi:hypothetical protein